MKYSFRLFETGSETEVGNSKGQPPNLQACPQCKTINLQRQATCILCGRALDPEKTPADNIARAAAAGMEGRDFSAGKKFPDIMIPPAMVAAAFPPGPDTMMANSQFSTGGEQEWLRWAWGLVLLLVLLAATGLLVFSMRQPPSAIPDPAKIIRQSEDNLPLTAPDKGPAATASAPVQHRPSTVEGVVVNTITPPAANRIRSVTEVPEIPVVPVAAVPQQTPAAANARCSDAQQALALCN